MVHPLGLGPDEENIHKDMEFTGFRPEIENCCFPHRRDNDKGEMFEKWRASAMALDPQHP
jgi:hypothetical protein